MGAHTNIEWCDSTINPTSGCDGCELWNKARRSCYAGNYHETRWAAPGSFADTMPQSYGRTFSDVRMIPGRIAQAAAWSDLRGKTRKDKPWLDDMPRCIFVGDMGDFMSRKVTDEFLKRELIGGITSKPGSRHFWMLLTKRVHRMEAFADSLGGLPDNVIVMTTATNQRSLNNRLPHLLKIKARWRGLSMEPLVGPVDLPSDLRGLDWIILGGESGPTAFNKERPRPMHPDWPRRVIEQTIGIDIFFKQWGNWQPHPEPPTPGKNNGAGIYLLPDGSFGNQGQYWDGTAAGMDLMKSKSGRLLGGLEWNGFPPIDIPF